MSLIVKKASFTLQRIVTDPEAVVIKPRHVSEPSRGLIAKQTKALLEFWFSTSGMEPQSLCFWQVPRWYDAIIQGPHFKRCCGETSHSALGALDAMGLSCLSSSLGPHYSEIWWLTNTSSSFIRPWAWAIAHLICESTSPGDLWGLNDHRTSR